MPPWTTARAPPPARSVIVPTIRNQARFLAMMAPVVRASKPDQTFVVRGGRTGRLFRPRLFRGTGRSGLYPGFHQCAGFFLGARGGGATETGMPCPADQGGGADMMDPGVDLSAT